MNTPKRDDVERLKEERRRLCLEASGTMLANRGLRQEVMQSCEQVVAQRERLADVLHRTAHLLTSLKQLMANEPLITDE